MGMNLDSGPSASIVGGGMGGGERRGILIQTANGESRIMYLDELGQGARSRVHPGVRGDTQETANVLEALEMLLQQAGATGGPVAADRSDISRLPTSKLSSTDVSKLPAEQSSCVICMETFVEGDEIRRLPCLHIFHKDCIDRWLGRVGSCPVCKHRVDGGPSSAE